MSDDSRLLTIDCGNSTIDCMRHDDGARLALAANAESLDGLRALVVGRRLVTCVAVSVVRHALDPVRALLATYGITMRVAGEDVPCPLPLDYATPGSLGADRWVGALAAHRLHGRAIVVDCGSATTVNLVEADGTFRGGPIAPGLRAFVAGMNAITPALPTADLDAAIELPSRSSRSAVDTGVLLGYAGLVERLVAGVLANARGPATVVVTGGNAARLLRHSRLAISPVTDLVHQGLRRLGAVAS